MSFYCFSQYLNFNPSQDVRDDLRSSMAKDAETIKNESLLTNAQSNTSLTVNGNDTQLPKDLSFNFQKKITLNKLESVIGNKETHNPLIGKIIFSIRITIYIYTLKSSVLMFTDACCCALSLC